MKLSELVEDMLAGKEFPETPATNEKRPAMLKWEEIEDKVFPPGSGTSIETVERVTEYFASRKLSDADIEYFIEGEDG